MISSAEELAEITALAEEAGAKFVWIGLHREAGELKWVTGESVDYYVWGSGEPSVTDSDGTPEDYVLLWHTDSGWIYNDCRNDPAAALSLRLRRQAGLRLRIRLRMSRRYAKKPPPSREKTRNGGKILQKTPCNARKLLL